MGTISLVKFGPALLLNQELNQKSYLLGHYNKPYPSEVASRKAVVDFFDQVTDIDMDHMAKITRVKLLC